MTHLLEDMVGKATDDYVRLHLGSPTAELRQVVKSAVRIRSTSIDPRETAGGGLEPEQREALYGDLLPHRYQELLRIFLREVLVAQGRSTSGTVAVVGAAETVDGGVGRFGTIGAKKTEGGFVVTRKLLTALDKDREECRSNGCNCLEHGCSEGRPDNLKYKLVQTPLLVFCPDDGEAALPIGFVQFIPSGSSGWSICEPASREAGGMHPRAFLIRTVADLALHVEEVVEDLARSGFEISAVAHHPLDFAEGCRADTAAFTKSSKDLPRTIFQGLSFTHETHLPLQVRPLPHPDSSIGEEGPPLEPLALWSRGGRLVRLRQAVDRLAAPRKRVRPDALQESFERRGLTFDGVAYKFDSVTTGERGSDESRECLLVRREVDAISSDHWIVDGSRARTVLDRFDKERDRPSAIAEICADIESHLGRAISKPSMDPFQNLARAHAFGLQQNRALLWSHREVEGTVALLATASEALGESP